MQLEKQALPSSSNSKPYRFWQKWDKPVEFMAAGGLSLLLLPLFLVLVPDGEPARLGLVATAAFWLTWVINDPHFLVTYQIFYRDFSDKLHGRGYASGEQIRYLLAGIVLPVLLLLWIGAMLVFEVGAMASGVMQLMFILVGWHYVKQGYGVLSVLSARRGIFYSKLESQLVITHCLITWIYAWSQPNAMPSEFEQDGVSYLAAGFGNWPVTVMFVLFVISGIAAIGILVRKFLTARTWPPLAPVAGLFVTLYLWVVWTGINEGFSYLIPAMHSVQYLFFVYMLERGRARQISSSTPSGKLVIWQLGKTALVALIMGALWFHFIPEWLDENMSWNEQALGPIIFMAMITAFINIHHFMMDNVMWRKGNPDMDYLRK